MIFCIDLKMVKQLILHQNQYQMILSSTEKNQDQVSKQFQKQLQKWLPSSEHSTLHSHHFSLWEVPNEKRKRRRMILTFQSAPRFFSLPWIAECNNIHNIQNITIYIYYMSRSWPNLFIGFYAKHQL